MLPGATNDFRQEFQVLMNRYLWTCDCQCLFLKDSPAPRTLATEKDPSYETVINEEWKHHFGFSKLTVLANLNPTPVPINLEDVSKPLVPKELFSHASPASLHLYYVGDHVDHVDHVGFALYCVSSHLRVAFDSSFSHTHYTASISNSYWFSLHSHCPIWVWATSRSCFIITTIYRIFLTQVCLLLSIYFLLCGQNDFFFSPKMPIYLIILFPCLKLLISSHCPCDKIHTPCHGLEGSISIFLLTSTVTSSVTSF